jgi:hypothetical protein
MELPMIEKLLEPWSLKTVQEAMQINDRLNQRGKTWEDVKNWFDEKKTRSTPQINRLKRKCPRCGKILNYSNVSSKSEKYAQGYRTYFLCGAACCKSKGCGYEEWSKLTIEEWKNKLSSKKEGR